MPPSMLPIQKNYKQIQRPCVMFNSHLERNLINSASAAFLIILQKAHLHQHQRSGPHAWSAAFIRILNSLRSLSIHFYLPVIRYNRQIGPQVDLATHRWHTSCRDRPVLLSLQPLQSSSGSTLVLDTNESYTDSNIMTSKDE